jgi:prophage antirepressor-like protein
LKGVQRKIPPFGLKEFSVPLPAGHLSKVFFMSNQLVTTSPLFYHFEDRAVRTLEGPGGEPWFVLKDLLDAMGSTTPPSRAIETIKEVLGNGVIANHPIPDGMNRVQPTYIVSSPGATFIVSRSMTDAGKRLNRWLHLEVLPAIQKTGSYGLAEPKARKVSSPKEFLTTEDIARRLDLCIFFEDNNSLTPFEGVVDHVLMLSGFTEHKHSYYVPTLKAKGKYKTKTYRKGPDRVLWDLETVRKAAQPHKKIWALGDDPRIPGFVAVVPLSQRQEAKVQNLLAAPSNKSLSLTW